MPITLAIRDDLSINDIVSLGLTHLVKVTPHVGNWTPARLVLPTLGISVLCVDHTIGNKDINAHPHLLIHGGEAQLLCEVPDRLTTHLRVTRKDNSGVHAIGTSLSDVHVGTLRRVFPTADIVTHFEHLKSNRDLTLSVLEEVTKLSVSATWWRTVNAEGVVQCHRSRNLPKTWREYERKIFPLTNEREGWLIHNRVAILMDIIIQSEEGLCPEIYHLSGPDMVRYLGGEIETLSRMYDQVRKRLGLPQEVVTFNLVPFASFRFATRQSQNGACVLLCEELDRSTVRQAKLRDLAEEARDIFAESETKKYFTQHDWLSTGEDVQVPEVARSWSMAESATKLSLVREVA